MKAQINSAKNVKTKAVPKRRGMLSSSPIIIALITSGFGYLGTRQECNHSETTSSIDTVRQGMRTLWERKHSKDSLEDVRRDSITHYKLDSIIYLLQQSPSKHNPVPVAN